MLVKKQLDVFRFSRPAVCVYVSIPYTGGCKNLTGLSSSREILDGMANSQSPIPSRLRNG